MTFRKETDSLGTKEIPRDAYWGIHTCRARENFNISQYRINPVFIKSFALVKLACASSIKEFDIWEPRKADAITKACMDLSEGKLDSHIIVDPVQGGAGTSLNMNVNEVIANRALGLYGKNKGEYGFIDPIEDINKFQSTNDVYPTALKIASIYLLRELEKEVTALQESFQAKEKEFADIVKIGRTQLMDAVLITLGKEFSAFAEAISRDRWRIYKCEERLRVVNIGGTAVGTGLTAPRKYIFSVIENLREITGIGLARAENLVENTQNLDVFAEASGILKAHAVNLIKISNDLRNMNSGPNAGFSEIFLPPVQVGSSVMPGKVNPVIPELAAQVGMKVLGNDSIINHCAAGGQFELNQNLPMIAFSFLETLELLINTNKTLRQKCIDGIKPDIKNLKEHVENSLATLTALLPELGYNKVAQIAKEIQKPGLSLKDYLIQNKYIDEDKFNRLTSPEAVLSLGHSKFIK